MNRRKYFLFIASLLLCVCCSKGERTVNADTPDTTQSEAQASVAAASQAFGSQEAIKITPQPIDPKRANAAKTDHEAGKRALLESYPDFISKIEGNTVYFKDGSTMIYDDGQVKDFQALLDDGDIEDMFFTPYNSLVTPPAYLSDPGRSRSEALYKKMYGNSAAAVQKNLVRVPWFGKSVQFTKVNGAADALRKVEAEISKYPELKKYIESSGTFYWRPVRGAKRQSAHSYGIAFDIAVKHSDYWQWAANTNNELAKFAYKNKFPRKIVEIFEKHGFIWGGAWYHYDTMHFEYRPELLRYSELTGNNKKP